MTYGTIWCVGRNYMGHAKEMKAELPTTPLIFIKSGGSVVPSHEFKLPSFSNEIHHELELALLIGDDLEIKSLALALDLTARDIQTELKKSGLPWAMAKSFTGSCPLSDWIPYQGDPWFETLEFELKVNSQIKQKGLSQDMIFKPQTLLKHIKQHFPLRAGDIILTGTPEGVGPFQSGDLLEAEISGHLQWSWKAL